MTSRRSPPRRSSGSRAALAALALGVALSGAARGAGSAPKLLERRDGVVIDWVAGSVAATAGSAADLRMPSADVARAGAARRAEATARARLRAALEALPLGGGETLTAAEVERALGRARLGATEYQSNGGVVSTIGVSFGDWLEEPSSGPPTVVLSVESMKLGAAPPVKLGGDARERRLGRAQYRVGEPPPDAHAVSAKVAKGDRLAFSVAPGVAEKLAKGLAVIYVRSVP